MELVAEKYNHTDLGLLPLEWSIKTIGEISNPVRGGSPRPAGDPKYFNGSYIPWLTVAALTNIPISQLYVSKTETYLTEEGSQHSRILDKGTVIIANSGATLGVAKILAIKCCANDGIAALLDIDNEVSKEYLVYYINTKIKYLREVVATGNGQPNLNTGLIGIFKVPIPPTKSEQTAIATALSDADALISSLEKLIAKKRNIKQGAMQKLLQPKEGWEHKTLGEIGEITGGGVDKLINEDEVPVRLVNYMDVFRRDLIYSDELTHWVTAPQSKIQKCAVKQGDIFFTPSSEMRFDIAVSAIAMENIPDAAYSYHLVRLRLFEDWDLHFRAYIFKTKYFLSQAEKFCEGSGKRYVITLPKFRSLKIYFPVSKDEQNAISTILFDMNAEIEALETKLEKYRNVKLGMMQNLLTGKIRLV